MRKFVLMAFCALQLSVFTCGFDIHVHAMDSDVGHVAEHMHEEASQHEQAAADHACHVHTSHTFTVIDTSLVAHIPVQSGLEHFALSPPHLKNLPFSIEYPPKTLHS